MKLKIIIVGQSKKSYSGGDIHFEILSQIFKTQLNIEVLWCNIDFDFEKFDTFNNSIALFKSLIYPINCKIKNDGNDNFIVISPSPYPFSVFSAIKLAKSLKGYPVIYFHHLSLSLKFALRRGIIRSLINYILNALILSICKIKNIPIFLDNADQYYIKGLNVFNDEDAPNVPDLNNKKYEKKFDICYIGRFQKHKGAMDLIKVANILKKDGLNIKIAVIGSLDEKFNKKIKKLLNKYNIENNFIFMGNLKNNDKVEVLLSSKLYVHLSYEEGWGMSVMDAAFLGIPIVAYELPAYSYLKRTYYAVPIGDVKKAAKTIKNALNNYNFAQEIAKKASTIVKEYNYVDIAKYQIDCFKKIMDYKLEK